jgi:hypothetical protein
MALTEEERRRLEARRLAALLPPTGAPITTALGMPPVPSMPLPAAPIVRVGQPITGDPLSDAILTRNVMAGAGSMSKIQRTPTFVEELPPMKRSRGKSFLKGLGRGALIGLAGGPGGALGGALTGGIIGAVSPGTLQKFERQEELTEQDELISRTYQQQRGASTLANEEVERLWRINQIERSQSEAERKAAHDAASLAIEEKKLAGTIESREADRQQKELDRQFREKELLERDRHNKETETIQRLAAGGKGDLAAVTNSALEQNIAEATTERDRIWASLKGVPPTITKPARYEGDPPDVEPNPIYTDLMKRGRELDDQIRDWRVKQKPQPQGTYTEQTVRQRAIAAGKDPNAAVQKARAAGLIK